MIIFAAKSTILGFNDYGNIILSLSRIIGKT